MLPFLEEYGVMYESDYPYVSDKTHTEGECKHDQSKIEVKVKNHQAVVDDPYIIRNKLKKGPM